MDTELQTLFQKLKDLGIFNDVDIIITADHGVQLDKKTGVCFQALNMD